MEPLEFKYARTSDGVSIAYSVTGRGPAIIFIGDILFTDVASPTWEVPELRNVFDDVFRGGYRVVV